MAMIKQHPMQNAPVSSMAFILVPNAAGRIQDLGPYLTGRRMETDILDHSAILCPADEEGRMFEHNGKIQIAFEGNSNRAVNLESFLDRLRCAAGRVKHKIPSVAFGRCNPEDISIVGSFNMDRLIIDEVFDAKALSTWSGEPIEKLTPPHFKSGSSNYRDILSYMDFGHTTLHYPPMICQGPSGQIYTQIKQGIPGRIYDYDDPDLQLFLEDHGITDKNLLVRICGRNTSQDLSSDPSDPSGP